MEEKIEEITAAPPPTPVPCPECGRLIDPLKEARYTTIMGERLCGTCHFKWYPYAVEASAHFEDLGISV